MAAKLQFRPEWRISLATALLLPLLVSLGFWQLQRAGEKTVLAEAFELRRQQPPRDLAGLAGADASSLAYLPVALTGTFVAGREILLDNRIKQGQFGNEVLGIIRLAEGGLAVVNRGWIAADPARRSLPEVPQVAGEVSLTGHIYVPPGDPYLLSAQDTEQGWPLQWQAMDMGLLRKALARQTPGEPSTEGELFPWVVRLDAGQPAALDVDWQIVNVSPAKHRGYAVQWFAMAAALAIIYTLHSSNLWALLRGRGRNDSD